MKTSKLFTIDVEVAERLKLEDNASGLVNDLLIDFYLKKDLTIQDIEELKKEVDEKTKIIEEVELNEIKEKEELKNKAEEKAILEEDNFNNICSDLSLFYPEIKDFDKIKQLVTEFKESEYTNVFKFMNDKSYTQEDEEDEEDK